MVNSEKIPPIFFGGITNSVRQLLRRPALVVGIDVRIDLGDLNGRVSEQGLHGTQLGAALDEVGRVGMPQLVRRQVANGQPIEKGIILPAERAGCHVAAALCRYNIDTRFRCVRQRRGKLVAVGDNANPLVLGHVHGRKLAFGNAGDDAPDRDGAVLLVDIVPAQTHDLLAADTGVQQNGNRCAERTVKMRDNVCKLLGLVDFDVLERRIRLDLDAVTRIATAQAVDNRAFHDLVNGDEDVVSGALAELGGIAHHALDVRLVQLAELHFSERRQDIVVEIQFVIGVSAVLDRFLFALEPFLSPACDGLPVRLRFLAALEKFLVGGFSERTSTPAERLLHMAAVRQVEPHAQLYTAVGLFAKTSVHNDKTPFLSHEGVIK